MSFTTYSEYSQDLKATLRQAPNWGSLMDDQREVLEVVASSLAHIVVNDPTDYKNWNTMYNYIGVIRDKLDLEEKKWQEGNVKTAKSTESHLNPNVKTVRVTSKGNG